MRTKKRSLHAVIALATAVLFTTFQLIPQFASIARAEGKKRRIAVFVLPASEGEVEAALLIGRMMRQNARQLMDVELITPAPVPNEQAIPQVTMKIDEAYKLLNNKQTQQAMTILTEIRPMFEQTLPGLPLRTIALFYKTYGVGQAMLGNMPQAKSALEICLILWPEQSNLEYVYSVPVINLFTNLQKEVNARASGELNVITEPENAVVIVDDKEPAQSPASVRNLTEGAHLVRVSLDGYEQWAGFVNVKGRDRTEHKITLKPIADKATFDARLVGVAQVIKGKPESVKPKMDDLKSFMAVENLLVVTAGVVGQAYEIKGFYSKTDGELVEVKRTINRDAEFYAGIKEFLSGTFEAFFGFASKTEGLGGPPIDPVLLEKAGITTESATTVFDPDNPVFPDVKLKKKKEKLTSKWWFWAGVGVLTIGTATGAILLLTGDDSSGGPTGSLEIELH